MHAELHSVQTFIVMNMIETRSNWFCV